VAASAGDLNLSVVSIGRAILASPQNTETTMDDRKTNGAAGIGI